MERKIGEIFEYNDEWYQCIEDTTDDNCNNCFFQKTCSDITGTCSSIVRSDGKSVCFKKLEKVGEPYEFLIDTNKKVLMQEYKIYGDMYIWENKGVLHTDCFNGIRIEIKQNKEDMEIIRVTDNQNIVEINGKKYKFVVNESNKSCSDNCAFRHLEVSECSRIPCTYEERKDGKTGYFVELNETTNNLKPFNLEAAKAGKPVCTRDGRKARIICFDFKSKQPIVAAISQNDGTERLAQYSEDGKYLGVGGDINHLDLKMFPQKREGWVNVYNSLGIITFSHNPYYTKKEALQDKGNYYVDTIKVSWRE